MIEQKPDIVPVVRTVRPRLVVEVEKRYKSLLPRANGLDTMCRQLLTPTFGVPLKNTCGLYSHRNTQLVDIPTYLPTTGAG